MKKSAALLLVIAFITILTVGCSATQQVADNNDQVQLEQPSVQEALVGVRWKLVEIASMDDSTYVPSDPSLYTFELQSNGSITIRADCNRGTGSWSSEYPGKIQFSQIAATQAMCLPGSLHDRYMGEFKWVRSYVMKNGHLFLATMADGSIIEFEPVED